MRERLRQQTSDGIVAAAFARFAEQGYEATTIEQIAAAGVSIRTFFRYFPSKEAVVFFDHPQVVGRPRTALEATDPEPPPVERVCRAMLASDRSYGDDARCRHQPEVVPAVRAHHARLVEDFEAAVAELLAPSLGTGPDAMLQARLSSA